MSYLHVPKNSVLPLSLRLGDGATGNFPTASVYNPSGSEIGGSPYSLSHVANGRYENGAVTASIDGLWKVDYKIYSDAGHTSLMSSDYSFPSDIIEVDEIASVLVNTYDAVTGMDVTVVAIQNTVNDIDAGVTTLLSDESTEEALLTSIYDSVTGINDTVTAIDLTVNNIESIVTDLDHLGDACIVAKVDKCDGGVMTSGTVEIVKGSDVTLVVQYIEKKSGAPVQLTGFTGATGFFPKDGGGSVNIIGSLVSEDLGTTKYILTETDSAELLAGDPLSMEIMIDQGTVRSIKRLEDVLTIYKRIF